MEFRRATTNLVGEGLLRRAWRRAKDTIADLLPVSLRRAELCWEGAPRASCEARLMDTCVIEVSVPFQDSPDDEQARRLAELARGVACGFGRIVSETSAAEISGEAVGRAKRMPEGVLRARLTLRPTGGVLDRVALDDGLRDAVSARHRRFAVLLRDPGEMTRGQPVDGMIRRE